MVQTERLPFNTKRIVHIVHSEFILMSQVCVCKVWAPFFEFEESSPELPELDFGHNISAPPTHRFHNKHTNSWTNHFIKL